MPSQAQEQAFRELKLNDKFFLSLLLPMEEAEGDFDVYLMENAVMPVLLQGLDALTRHVDKIATGKTLGDGRRFNPVTWLAQYLLRNHPMHSTDHRAGMYKHLQELASVERGRRNLLRRLPEFENIWHLMSQDGQGLDTPHITQLLEKLDTSWNLEGEFIRSLPSSFAAQVPCVDPEKVTFNEFWIFFEEYVSQHDLLRTSVFEAAEQRRLQAEAEAQLALELQAQKEANLIEEQRQQRLLQAQFETLCADAYINGELSQIMSKGAVLQHPMDLKGEHIVLLLQLLRAWGFSLLDDQGNHLDQDEWDDRAKSLFTQWRMQHGPTTNFPGVVDSDAVKALMDKESFEAHHQIPPAPEEPPEEEL
ncbi:unnamed protein product [Effrenium voratum]|uniref:Uncharacterized protein n=1 Tax=Effrenium voratum TaxID=2562239 RepID=A0AA36N9R7_9DINO|nr:unnamed protein product [Effrenium voratum]CAJ1441223.1 unnamed protein product [Effrenium voratum]